MAVNTYSLALNTANGLHVGIFKDSKQLVSLNKNRGEINLSDEIITMVSMLLENAEISLENLSFLSVIKGAGYFTGIRIGLSVAKVLQQALKVPCIPLSNFEVMARELECSIGLKHGDRILGCSDIGKEGGVFSLHDENLNMCLEPTYVGSAEISDFLKHNIDNFRCFIVGDIQDLFLPYENSFEIIFNPKIAYPSLHHMNAIAGKEYEICKDFRKISALYGKDADVLYKKLKI